jgi:pimeloyl-ACP methyl ester carboxylesterase
MEIVEVNGLRLGYRRAGGGPSVVFVHGGGDDGRAWTPQLEALADEFTVVAWDEPGAGASDDVPPGFGLSDYADALAGLIRTLGVAPAAVVGLSWGSTVALELWRRDPAVVRSLVLADAYAGWRGSLGADEADARLAAIRAAAAARNETSGSLMSGLFAGEPPAEVLPLLEQMAASARPHSMATALTAMAAADLTAVLSTIEIPTLLVWGALDARSPLAVAHEFRRRIPGAVLSVIPDCGHLSNLEAPEAFNQAVRDFLRRPG